MKHQLEIEHLHAEKLEELDHMKSHFFVNISHEFRTPLTLIQGPIKQILSGEFRGNLMEQCRIILRYCNRLLNLINQILDLSRLESDQSTLRVSCTNISQFLKGIIQSFASLAERKKINLKYKVDEEKLMGYVDRDKVEKIVTNLLSNAFKFTPEKGRIEVALSLRGDLATTRSTKKSLSNINFEGSRPSPIVLGEGGPQGGTGGVINESLSYPSPDPFPYTKGKGQYDSVEISISNTGPGIPAEQLDKIFDRFYQADTTYKKDGEGSGIGLALTKELVEVHHGKIKVESEVNKGTTFTVWLPIGKEHFKPEEIVEESVDKWAVIEPTPQTPPLVSGDGRGVEITPPVSSINHQVCRLPGLQSPVSGLPSPLLLIVEDNPDVTSYISSFMKNDYRILTAENGKEGFKKALDKYPDLIISDVMMPVMDGFELCHKLKSDENTSHIPVILLTAKADMDSKIEGLEFGADDYISKPFDARELHARVKNLIEQRKKLREKFAQTIEINPGEITASSMDEQFLKLMWQRVISAQRISPVRLA